jgi:hypothetical protein
MKSGILVRGPEGEAMKRILFGLGVGLALVPAAWAQDGVPAARLGSPAATLGRPVIRAQGPELITAVQADGTPKTMPKGTVAEPGKKDVPGTLPMPGPVLGAAPGAVYGPVIVDPPVPGASVYPGVPGVPGVDGCPAPGCPTPGLAYGGSPDRWYTSAEALLWFFKSYSTPPLLTAGPTNVAPVNLGAIGVGGATVLVGNDPINANPQPGGRFTLGYWFSPRWAIEATGFLITEQEESYTASSGGYPNQALGRPFFSANRNQEAAELIGLPGAISGTFAMSAKSQLYGAEINFRRRWWDTCDSRLDFLVGLRYLRLQESIVINESAEILAGQFAGLAGSVTDSFLTRNQFYGAQIGASYDRNWGRWSFGLWGKLGIGVTQQLSEINGFSSFANGTGTDRAGGLLALDSNIGSYKQTEFSVVPEVGLTVGYNVTDRLRVFAGYSFLYWSSVARPGKQIDRTLDENRIPEFAALRAAAGVPAPPAATSVRPVGRVESETFWAQGFSFGLQFRW